MILTPLPLDNPWKRSSIGFFMFNMLSILMIWIIFDIKEFSSIFIEKFFFLVPLISVLLFFLGNIFPVIDRTKFFVLILGVFGISPILLSCILPFFIYILISKFSFDVKFFAVLTYVALSIFWMIISIKKTASMEKNNNYLKSQINDVGGKKIIKRENLLDFSILDEKRDKIESRIMKKIVIPLSIVAYPLQKLVSAIGGDTAIFGSISILSVPLSFYIMGRIVSGYYLWVYRIGKLEKEYESNIIM